MYLNNTCIRLFLIISSIIIFNCNDQSADGSSQTWDQIWEQRWGHEWELVDSEAFYYKSKVALSDDGTRIAIANFAEVKVSEDSGQNWISSNYTAWAEKIAISRNGMIVAVCGEYDADVNGGIHVSTDGGTTFSRKRSDNYRKIVASRDGARIIAVEDPDSSVPSSPFTIQVSSNIGETWSDYLLQNDDTDRITSVASSVDGLRLVISGSLSGYGFIYTSSNGGESWIKQVTADHIGWNEIACSGDCQTLVACPKLSSPPTISYNGGKSWETIVALGNGVWKNIVISEDGLRIAIVKDDSFFCISTDGGETWNLAIVSSGKNYSSLCMLPDGSQVYATIKDAGTYGYSAALYKYAMP